MAKNSPSAFSLHIPGHSKRTEAPALASAPIHAPASPVEVKPKRVSVPEGCKSVTFYPARDAWRQLRDISEQRDQTIADLMLDVLDAYLTQQGLTPNARKLPTDEPAR